MITCLETDRWWPPHKRCRCELTQANNPKSFLLWNIYTLGMVSSSAHFDVFSSNLILLNSEIFQSIGLWVFESFLLDFDQASFDFALPCECCFAWLWFETIFTQSRPVLISCLKRAFPFWHMNKCPRPHVNMYRKNVSANTTQVFFLFVSKLGTHKKQSTCTLPISSLCKTPMNL